MSITVHASSSALGPGSELWVLPSKEHSQWARRLDFYMNFQISKSGDHQPRTPSLLLEEIQNHFHLQLKNYSFEGASNTTQPPLMIATHSYFPNKNTVIIPFLNSSQWLTTARDIFKHLGRPHTRLFLPDKMEAHDVEKVWPTDLLQDLSLVLDTGP